MDRESAGQTRAACPVVGRTPRPAPARPRGAAAAAAGARGGARSHRAEDQRAESKGAVGIVRARWAHLPQLAADGHARIGARLRPHPRADAPPPARPLTGVLAARVGGVPRVSRSTGLAAGEWAEFAVGVRFQVPGSGFRGFQGCRGFGSGGSRSAEGSAAENRRHHRHPRNLRNPRNLRPPRAFAAPEE